MVSESCPRALRKQKDETMDLKELQTIMEMFEKSGLVELTLKMNGEEVCLKKTASSATPVPFLNMVPTPMPPVPAVAPANAAPIAPAASPKEGEGKAASDIEVIRAPLVGTFYRAPATDAPPFVEKGDKVKKGQTLCILEAMKLMNEFQAEFDLEIVNILAENGRMVEYGTPLFEVRRT
jgi:acetyl-CoA carboxylase biotin carboxyl carrier protein